MFCMFALGTILEAVCIYDATMNVPAAKPIVDSIELWANLSLASAIALQDGILVRFWVGMCVHETA